MIATHNLDDPGFLQAGDPGGMLAAVESFRGQCEDALKLGEAFSGLPSGRKVKGLCFIGMGGSGIGGDILQSLLAQESGLPVRVHKDYGFPGGIGTDTLVIATSYSGNTEETLSGFRQAVAKGYSILVVTSGGELREEAARHGIPSILVPQGLQPRAALGYLTLPAGIVLERIGLLGGFSRSIRRAVDLVERQDKLWMSAIPTVENEAKRMAMIMRGKIPLVYGTQGPLRVAAYRWKCQFNENSKNPAFYNDIPEMDHNEIAGWNLTGDLGASFAVTILVGRDVNARMARKVKVTAQLLKESVAGVEVVEISGETVLEQLLSAVHLGDYISVYLALLKGVDPTPVDVITMLKKKMAEGDRAENKLRAAIFTGVNGV
jgi:glucose/mannose-6-phosphate isomerase